MVYFAHDDDLKAEYQKRVNGLVTSEEFAQAKRVGALFHLASFLDPGARGILHNFNLQQKTDGSYEILGPEPFMKMQSESVAKRLEIFNNTLA